MNNIQLSDHFTYNKLIRFTLPTIVMMIFSSIYGVVDGIFVSNIVGKDAFAAVNLIYPAIMILGSIGFMIGTGGSAIVSKTLGEGDNEKANRYFSMLIYLELILGVIFTIIGIIFIKPITYLLGATEELAPYCITYGRILIMGLTFFFLQMTFSSFVVVANKPKMGLYVTVAAGVSNMILDFLLIYVFKMGIFGAGLASVASQIVGAGIPLVYFARKNNSLLHLTKTHFELKPIIKTCTNGSSEMVTQLSMSLVNMLYNLQLMKYAGSNGVSAYGIIMYVGFIFVGVFVGYSVGSAPLIGFNYGAKNNDELKNILKKSLILLGTSSAVLTILAEIFAKPLASIFVSYDLELFEMTTIAIRLFAISYLLNWFNIFASSFFTALNNGLISAIISFVRTFIFEVSMIFLLPIFFGLNGIWLSVVVAEFLSLLLSLFFMIKNGKKYGYV